MPWLHLLRWQLSQQQPLIPQQQLLLAALLLHLQ
jgi:hypothetical protein